MRKMQNILWLIVFFVFALVRMQAQIITIGGNVYGGGNQGNTGGKTTVTIYDGDIHHVYGGARMADVAGSAFVNIDGANSLAPYIIIDQVCGGNDISGHVGSSAELPAELTQKTDNGIDASWNTFVRTSSGTGEGTPKIFIGRVFGGGNGDYNYIFSPATGIHSITDKKTGEVIATSDADFYVPDVAKTYLEILGGTIDQLYAGGNNATITDSTVICFDNTSTVVTSILDASDNELLNDTRLQEKMEVNTVTSYVSSDEFQVGRCYGGNNLAEMHIRPKWALKSGGIRHLYSGGNRGDMTSPYGLLLEIPATSTIKVDNLYGGCRMANVKPTVNGEYKPVDNLPGYNFPAGLSARVLVRGGDINNVYGGNDITGRVYGGSAIGIYTSVRGDVYGGGNGSYPYTDNDKLENTLAYGDFYYGIPAGKTSVEALNDFRPNAEQVSIRLAGDDALHPTIIGGSVYCGGNSASLKTNKSKPMVELKLGSYVIAENVFLGNNGENIVKYNAKDKDETGADDPGAPEGVLYTMQRTDIPELEGTKFSSLNLETPATFEAYMQGVAMPLLPNVVFDDETRGDPETYIPYTALVGSFFCGGNVGSISAPGTIDLNYVSSVRIYNKFVGGCNNAYVPAHAGFNAACDGGFTVESHPKINVNLNGLKLCPLKLERDLDGKPTGVSPFLAWNLDETTYSTKRYVGANIYGGCYNSGHINGDVVININESTVNKQKLFEDDKFNIFGEETDVQLDKAGVSFDEQREEIFITSLGIFGAGYGLDSEIWGSTTLNFNNGYNFLVFGGGEMGAVGKKNGEGNYVYDAKYSTYVNLNGTNAGTADGTDIPAAEYIYAGGFEGLVAGDTYMNLGNGRVNASFGGACNADILGHAETYVGKGGYPYVVEDVYGANDLGGRIRGTADFKSKVREGARALMHNGGAPATASAYVEYLQGRVRNIFGGCYGKYDYSAITTPTPIAPYQGTINVDVDGYERQVLAPYIPNAFVHLRPEQNNSNSVAAVFGAGEGDTNYEADGITPKGADPIGDMLQDRSYVLVDIPEGYLNMKGTEIYGAGSFNGLGMWVPKATADAPATADQATAIIDLISGNIDSAHGGGYAEGLTRRTLVNVPDGSIIKIGSIFGGAEGTSTHKVCDVYEGHVNYNSEAATVGTLYGGNDAHRQTMYAHVDVNKTAWSDKAKGYKATVYGAGLGFDTWAYYTEVNLNDGATVYEVYGGGERGRVANLATSEKIAEDRGSSLPQLPNGYGDPTTHIVTGLKDAMAKVRLDGLKHNTNVLIHKGATVENYAYGGGRGYDDEDLGDGDVYGTSYIALMGGTVKKDMYAAGTIGAVLDEYGDLEDYRGEDFVADATAYVVGGSTRNVYGGGWKGSVGKHKKKVGDVWEDAAISDIPDGTTVIDIPGTTHVYIGIRNDQSDASKLATVKAALNDDDATLSNYGFYAGDPTVQRNAYGGGEGGAVYGTTNVILNNGHIGYVYEDDTYKEKLDDETWTDHVGKDRLLGSGNIFGGGYIDNSSVDTTNVVMWGGTVRNSLFGGGEIAAIGRGDVNVSGYNNSVRTLNEIYKHGKTRVEMFNGHVLRDVFAGGKGYDNLGRVGTLYTDGYVFGQTEAHIHGGEVGTAENYDEGYGNVFGGGDLGYVYGVGEADTEGVRPSPNHYYYKYYDTEKGEYKWSEDCKVVVEPWAQVTALGGVNIAGRDFAQYDYVPTDSLNRLKGKNDITDGAKWAALDDSGIIIHNAIFGGGNVANGSDKVYANTKTVFGNVTAAVRDVICRDLITIGTEHVGGLYGGGNLSLVDGYRELHIANYGTDYYSLQQEITMEQYDQLTDRERAYFRLRYTCKTEITAGKDKDGIAFNGYSVGQQIFDDEYNELPDSLQNETYWTQDGVCSIYAGRLLNTLQRADLAGVYGSRMVLQGAEDRVTDVQDKQRYTINRIGELSLKAVNAPTGEEHGNYFGIYSLVNYLGNLTSDVQMNETRTTDSGDEEPAMSYHDYKAANANKRNRNTATCNNQVALASGVFLELVNEPGRVGAPAEGKDYGYITGVVELDLINAKADAIGGGYVYAKNEHGARGDSGETLTTLSPYNTGLRTYKMYTYNENTLEQIQTSGNFIHGKKKTIIDDCYPHNLEYTPGTAKYSTAHYWYIKGSIYIYDQIINAYTGSPTAYTKETHIPVTITSGAHGKLKLVDIKQNKYAYYNTDGVTPLSASDTIKVNNNSVSFGRNDVISYWDWSQLPVSEQHLFVDNTYVNVETGEVSNTVQTGDDWHMSNNISHGTGYVLDFKMDTPPAWNTWYSPKTGSGDDKINTPTYDDLPDGDKNNYIPGPTYSTSANGVFGQRTYTVGEVVPHDVVTAYSNPGTGDQATIEDAYVASEAVSYTYDSTPKSVSAGTPIPYSEWNAITDATVKAKFGAAKMCISTLRLNEQTYIVYGDLLNATDIATLKTAFPSQTAAIDAALTPAHVCSVEGLYGGTSYSAGTRYDAIKGWAALTSADRAQNKFSFNYDGLDVLIDPKYSGDMSKYHHPYDQTQSVEYVAIYNGAEDYVSPAGELNKTIHVGDTLSRTEYETLWNEKYHYTAVVVSTTEPTGDDYYIAKKDFARGNMAYAKGQVIPAGAYRNLSTAERDSLIEVIKFTNLTESPVTYYYCRDNYTGNTSVTNRNNGGTVDTGDHGSGTTVTAGWVIDSTDFGNLQNNQKNYLIKGEEPTESSTLYVSRESNIKDLSREKIISVMYQYTYNESGDDGNDATLVNEMHIVNVHILFESGAPIIEPLLPPATVLPGTTVGMNQPKVTPGAYELIGGGWEIYSNESDANTHRNGTEYINNNTPMYWYQDDYYVAYYAKSYLGKTYSNPVQFSVANYHDLKTVLEAADKHHYYIDHIDAQKNRQPKIYINDYTDDGKNGLDLLKDLYDLTIGESGAVETYGALDTPSNISGADNLDIIFRTNIRHEAPWTPIGSGDDPCFSGNIHGDGHYVSALDHSLFGKLCGHVYNLGVMGTFTGGGIADVADNSGSAENCWIKTSGTPAADTKAVIGSYSSIDQVKNCYYPGNEAFDTTAPAAAMKASKTDFYYGDVAYRLNRFYLLKRYNLNRGGQEVATDTTYVTSRYGNPDFLYADGTIPEEVNLDREKKTPSGDPAKDPTTGEQLYVPLYPYDYLFFGQALNYGHLDALAHQDVPSPIVKEEDVVETGDTGNRVYRAPAYFRNSTMSKVYFNPYAVFAKTNAAESEVIHKGMTAVDFTGYNDAFVGSTGAAKSYGNGTVDGKFFPPLLDVDEVSHISNYGLTKNLLVYTEDAETGESASVAGKTGRAVQLSLGEPSYDVVGDYCTVAAQDESSVNGHWVYRDAGEITYSASNDHLLIDKNDFWAPIEYEFDGSSRMWYQRTPDTFAGLNTGWESVVLPFTVQMVSTHQKGEITHFYGNDIDGKIGHEYWLRKYTAIETGDEANTMKATFTRPAKNEGADAYDKVYTNTFLWDELHEGLSGGQNQYYKTEHTYEDYPLQQQATPYIIGFPGKDFYEFDLSGQWTAAARPTGFDRQTVTFASHTGATIRQSNDDMDGVTQGDYTFTPSYLNQDLEAGTPNYVMASDGSKYVKVPAEGDATPILPFRAYFAKSSNSGNTLSIVFSDAEGKPDVTPEEPKPEITPQGEVNKSITFTPGVGTITAKSTLDEPRVILVYGVSGALVKAFDIKPNATVTIYVPSGLVYAIRTVSGDYSSKLLVK